MELLTNAVIEQLGFEELEDEELRSTLEDITNNGADGGFGGFTYYSETNKFARENMHLIMDQVKELADALGETPLEMISNFGCLKPGIGEDKLDPLEIASIIYWNYGERTSPESQVDGTETVVLNALAWFALEEVARDQTNF